MITREAFENETALLTDVLVDQVLAEKALALTDQKEDWFRQHVSHRFRWFYTNDPKWRKWLDNRGSVDPRDQGKVWIRHWLAAFALDPERYQEQHQEIFQ